MNIKSKPVAMGVLVVCAAISTAAEAAKWKVTDLGTVGVQSFLYLNNSGQVAGTDTREPQGGGPYTAFVTGPNGTNRRNVYSDATVESVADGINDAGILLSVIRSGDAWTRQSSDANSATPVFHDIAKLMYSYQSAAINNKGQIAGQGAISASGEQVSFISNADGTSITPLSGASTPADINETGRILLQDSLNAMYITGANGVGQTKIKYPAGVSSFYARRLNDAGQAIGELRYQDNMPHAFITGPNGVGVIDLGTLGSSYSDAFGVNNAGQVVGTYSDNFNFMHAFVTEAGGKNPRDLTQEVTLPVGSLTAAYAINDKGQIAAADYYNGRAYLLTPDSACGVTYKVTSTSHGKFEAKVTVANFTNAALRGWTVNWNYSAATFLVSVKHAKLVISGSTAVSAIPDASSITVPANGATSFILTGVVKGETLPTVKDLKGALGGKACAASVL